MARNREAQKAEVDIGFGEIASLMNAVPSHFRIDGDADIDI